MARYLLITPESAATLTFARGVQARTANDPDRQFVLMVPSVPLPRLFTWEPTATEEVVRPNVDLAGDYLGATGLKIIESLLVTNATLDAIDFELRHRRPAFYRKAFVSTALNHTQDEGRHLPANLRLRVGVPFIHVPSAASSARRHAGLNRGWVEERLAAFDTGAIDLSLLPLENIDFWDALLSIVARRRGTLWRRAFDLLEAPLNPLTTSARTTAALRALGTDPGRYVRRIATGVLSTSYDPSVRAAARRALSDPDLHVRLGATRLLAVSVLDRQGITSITSQIATILARRWPPGFSPTEDAGALDLPGLIKSLGTMLSLPSGESRWLAACCLARLQTPTAAPALLRALHDDSLAVTLAAADGLLALGPTANAPVLASYLDRRITSANLGGLRHYAAFAAPRRTFRFLDGLALDAASETELRGAIQTILSAL